MPTGCGSQDCRILTVTQEEKLADKLQSCYTGTMTAPFDALCRATCRGGERLCPFLRMHPRHVRRSASMASASRAVASVGKESGALLVVTTALPCFACSACKPGSGSVSVTQASGADCSRLAPLECHRGRKLGLSLSGVSYWTRLAKHQARCQCELQPFDVDVSLSTMHLVT